MVVGNEGTTLWFAQANQPANGVAELTVSGLLPTLLYEFRFASAWIGAGASDPANNNAIYLLEILDGATVLATRTRNTSNGSNVFRAVCCPRTCRRWRSSPPLLARSRSGSLTRRPAVRSTTVTCS
ncbi:hypothetical protein ACR6C2_07675 [Streptomyces sp. INA 01156]